MSAFSFGVLGESMSGTVYTIADILPPGILFDAAILFAFATYYPKYEIRLFFFLPVPIFLLAIFSGVGILMVALSAVPFMIYVCGCLAHYLIIAVPMIKSRGKQKIRKVTRQQQEKKPKSFHTCEKCGKKDTDDKTEYFRVTVEGEELCGECLKKKS